MDNKASIVDDTLSECNDELVSKLQIWIREYTERKINSHLIDSRRSISPNIILDMGNKGLLGMQVPKMFNGLALNNTQSMRLIQQLGALDTTIALFVGLSNVLGVRPIEKFAQDEIKQNWLAQLSSGRQLAAFALTEPEAGSNPAAIETKAQKNQNGYYLLSGIKIWSGNAAWAGIINIFAKTFDENDKPLGISCFAVSTELAGVTIGEEALTMGMRGMPQSKIILDKVKVPERFLLGKVGQGMLVAQDAMMYGRLIIGGACVGGIKRCLLLMERYATRRKISTGRLISNPVTLNTLTNFTHATTALETLVNSITANVDCQIEVPNALFITCKMMASEWYWQTADALVQLLGGRGYIESNIAPQILRDARILRIFEGPTETFRMFLGAEVLSRPKAIKRYLIKNHDASQCCEKLDLVLQQLKATFNNETFNQSKIEYTLLLKYYAGQIAAYIILEAVLTKQQNDCLLWLREEYNLLLKEIFSFNNELLSEEKISTIIQNYKNDIGDIEQQFAGEEYHLDTYLLRDIDILNDTNLI